MAKNSKVIRMRRRRRKLDIGFLIFAVVFIYLAYSIYSYFSRDNIQFYEVVEGSIVNDKNYSGIILRQENVVSDDTTGYVNFLVREGKRAAKGASVYSLDETGDLGRFLSENASKTSISDEGMRSVKNQLSGFASSYTDSSFSTAYSEQYSLQGAVSEYMNQNELSSLQQALQDQGINYKQASTSEAGVVSYIIDGFEGTDAASLTKDSFDRSKYKRSTVKSGELTEAGTPIYKLITSEDWSIVFPLDDDAKNAFDGKNTLTIKTSQSDIALTGNYSVIDGQDGAKYGKLDFDKYMIQFCSDRFVDFEVISDQASGLKIPDTAVVQREFYTIPPDYLTNGGNGGDDDKGFNKQVYGEDGSTSVEFTPVDIYRQTNDYVYVEKTADGKIQEGDVLVKPNSDEKYTVGKTEPMEGAFNINKGYAVFRPIEKLTDNGEYMIVRKDTQNGLAVYDHIVLDASQVTDNQLIYQ